MPATRYMSKPRRVPIFLMIRRLMSAQRPSLRVHLALLVVQLLFAGFAVVGKAVLLSLPPLVLAPLRVLGATPLLLLIAWRHDRLLPQRRDLPLLVLLGLLGVTANQMLFVLGLQRTTAINASILMPSIPVFAIGIGALLRHDRPSLRRLAGIALAVLGALVVLDPTRLSSAPGAVHGNALILGNCLCWAAFLVLQRPLLQRLPWRTTLAWSFLFGGAGVVLLSLPGLVSYPVGAIGWKVWAGIAYVVVFATVVGYSLNTWAVRRSSPALVAAYTTVQPVMAAALAFAFLGEDLGWRELVGFVLIGGGLVLAGGGGRPRGETAPDDTAVG
jgi:drug/metabolite transporter (DMT)-like permease